MPASEQIDEANRSNRPLSEFPDSRFPTAFADGVSSLTPGPGIVKFFFYRVDPNTLGRGGTVNSPFLQIAMHNYGFAQMTLFFQRQLKKLVEQKQIPQAIVDQMEGELDMIEAAQTAPQSTTGSP
jgi:hypothetical protein